MCSPQALVGFQAAASTFSFLQNRANAKSVNKFNKQAFEVNKQLAMQSAFQRYGDLRTRQAQEEQAAAFDIDRVSREALAASGTARVAGAEAGVAGQSMAALLGDFKREEQDFVTGTLRNKRFSDASLNQALLGIQEQTQSRIFQGQQAKVPVPSYLQGALQVGSDTLGAFASLYKYSPETQSWDPKG